MTCKHQVTHNHTQYSPSGVYFVSRYHNTSYYCVDGEECALQDREDGTALMVRGNAEQFAKLRLFLLDQYADYCRWSAEQTRKELPVPLVPWTPCYYGPEEAVPQ